MTVAREALTEWIDRDMLDTYQGQAPVAGGRPEQLMRALITGEAGYLGVPTVATPLAAGHDLRLVVHHLDRMAPASLGADLAGIDVVVGDVLDADSVIPAVDGRDAVVNADNVLSLHDGRRGAGSRFDRARLQRRGAAPCAA